MIAALRIPPIINKRRKKHETRKEFLAKINRHYKEGEKIINGIRKQLGYDDPIINKFEMEMSSYEYDGKESFLCRFQLEGNEIPVGEVIEYIFNKVCPAILIVQVVGMFPDIHREDRLQPVGYGCVRIGGRDDL